MQTEKKRIRLPHLAPGQTIMIGFALMILTGAALLTLPVSSQSGQATPFIDALFVATSANCVTGLVTVNTMAHWTTFGKVVVITLIQLGGLGFMTVMCGAMILIGRRVSLRERLAIQASFNMNDIGGMVRLVKTVVLATAFFEGIGAVLLMLSFFLTTAMTPWECVYQGVFHSISAFCNAGFDNIGPDSLTPFQANIPINLVITGLIVAGGLGFTVWGETAELLRNRRKKSLRLRIARLSLHAKIAILVTAGLILSGVAAFLVLEWSNPATLGPMPVWRKTLAALFQSVTLRTAGFNTISQADLTDASKAFSSLLMVIGGGSASAAGGMKTVTFGIFIIAVLSVIRGKRNLEAFGRTLPLDMVSKALTVAVMMLTMAFGAALLLHLIESGNPFPHTFLDLLFETSSAAGTVGITAGMTPHLSVAGKLVLICCMYAGRLGPVTVVIALNARLQSGASGLTYPREQVLIG